MVKRNKIFIPVKLLAGMFLFVFPLLVTVAPAESPANASARVSVVRQAAFFDEWLKNVWDEPPLASSFVSGSGRNLKAADVELRTEAWVVLLPDGLGIAVRCWEKDIDGLVARYGAGKSDKILPLTDDTLEIFIDVNTDGEKAFGIAINSRGAVYDGLYFPLGYADNDWDSGVKKPIVGIGKDAWTVAVHVPFSALGVNLSPGDIVGMAFYRTRHRSGQTQRAAWPQESVYGIQDHRLLNPFRFAPVQLAESCGNIKFVSLTRGRLSANASPAENSFVGYFHNRGGETCEVAFEAALVGKDGKEKIFWQGRRPLHAEQIQPVGFRYPVGSGRLVFRARNDTAIIYESYAGADFSMPPRIHDTGGDFYPEMVKVREGAPSVQGYANFPHQVKENIHLPAYTPLGMEYSLDREIASMVERELPIVSIRDGYNNLEVLDKYFRKYGARVIFYPNVARLATERQDEESRYQMDRRDILPAEAFRKDYFQALREGLDRYGDMIFAVFIGDEMDYMFHRGLNRALRDRKNYPEVMEIDREVRENFGFGRYGLVKAETSEKDIPYCKIATQRWLNDWMARLINEAVAVIHDKSPGIKIIGDDQRASVHPCDYRRRWGNVDIIMHQTWDKPDQSRSQRTSVITKVVKDISGVEEFWPCVHIPGYPGGYTVEEMREMMSRAFRNGATGITYYDTAMEGRSAPDRWRYLQQLTGFYAKGHRARLPETSQLGFLYSNYTSMADYSRNLEPVYNYLGPASGAYFKVIDDCSLERGDVDASQYKVVFVQYADYSTPEVVRRLEQAVREEGTTLVITEPRSFTLNIDGSDLGESTKFLGGVKFNDDTGFRTVIPCANAPGSLQGIKHMTVRKAVTLTAPGGDTEQWLQYEDGGLAAVSVKIGRGRVILLGFNPFAVIADVVMRPVECPTKIAETRNLNLDDQGMVHSTGEFFRGLLSSLDIPLNERIWQLKLPAPDFEDIWPDGFSLSGNSIIWSLKRPRTGLNMPALGRYRYSLPPQQKEETDKHGWISFANGLLTDRGSALREGLTGRSNLLTWKKSKSFSLDIDLGYNARVVSLDMFYDTQIPGCELLVSEDGTNWRSVDRAAEVRKSNGNYRLTLAADSAKARYLRVNFEEIRDGDELTLLEMDIWGWPDF